MAAPKQIAQTSIVGQQGINLIERVVLAMGFTWHPTNSGLEAGLDGFIEIRNPTTGELYNSVIFVQSRATEGAFTAETADSFEYVCSERDLDYWLKGNAPIIFVRSRPKTDEAYWIPVREYFADVDKRNGRKICFDKTANRFNSPAGPRLMELSLPPSSGIYFGPEPRSERLYSNLLEVSSFPQKIWVSDTAFRWESQVKGHFHNQGIRMGGEWFLKEKKIVSFYDLTDSNWEPICDPGTTESFDSSEWAYSASEDRRRDFVRLLTLSLRRKLHHLDVAFDGGLECFYFKKPEKMNSWREEYQSLAKRTGRHVVEYYPNKIDASRAGYYRHLAFSARFVLFTQAWFLQLVPTYYYTRDGVRRSKNYEVLLSGMKRIEHNSAVLGQTVFLAEYLSRPTGLFGKSSDLHFKSLAHFELPAGIRDDEWLSKEEDLGADIKQGSDQELHLFS